MIREELIPVRNIEAEEQLKKLILEIEEIMDDEDTADIVEEKLEQAKQFIKNEDRVLDLDVIEQYYSWTSLEGLVGEFTMQVPVNVQLSEAELYELITYLRENLVDAILDEDAAEDDIDDDIMYKMDFYRSFFEENYPDCEDVFDMLYDEDETIDGIVKLLMMEK